MNKKLRIKHDIPDNSLELPLTLVYDDSTKNFPELSINVTSSEQVVELQGWDGDIDARKIALRESQIEDNTNDKIYQIETLKINLESPENADEEVIEEELGIEESTETVEENSHKEEILDTYRETYSTGGYNIPTGEKICTDETIHLYDRSYDIRHTTYNMNHYTDAQFAAEYGQIMNGAFLARKSSSTQSARISYTSIYFGSVLIEANSQYARIKDWAKSTIMSQTINEEGKKNGFTTYGYIQREYRLMTTDAKFPEKKDTIINVYEGDDSEVLTICFSPDWAEPSTSYRTCLGNIYVDGNRVCQNGAFVRVRLKKNQKYTVTADNINYMNKSNWNVLAPLYVSVPLYSDNILRIVIYNENNDHEIYPDLYRQAKENNWGLPDFLFTQN